MNKRRISYPSMLKAIQRNYPEAHAKEQKARAKTIKKLLDVDVNVEDILKYLLAPERYLRLLAEAERRNQCSTELLGELVDTLPATPQEYLDISDLL